MKYKHNFIYKTTNLINGKTYVGKHQTNNLNDNYLGSGIALNGAIKKYGKKNFKREILEFCLPCKFHINEKEIFWIKNLNTKNRKIGYNLTNGGEGVVGFKQLKKSIDKMLKTREEKGLLNHSEETKIRMSESWDNRDFYYCKYCDFESKSIGNMYRWHNENCKFK